MSRMNASDGKAWRGQADMPLGSTRLTPNYRMDLRGAELQNRDRFIDADRVRDWSLLSWRDVGRPHQVRNLSREALAWEREHERRLPVKTSWEMFNRAFHEWFVKDIPEELSGAGKAMLRHLARFRPQEVKAALQDVMRLGLWNYVHRIEDGIWDPRGKRALFRELALHKPRILFLGAAEGYEAMQLSAMYPGGETVLVDYDPYCRTHRHAEFPDAYPFLGMNPATGGHKVWHKSQMRIAYIVDDIRNLPFSGEFDVVLSVGLLEHFPDEHKPEVMSWHRKFLKPDGYAILTTPRDQWRSRLFYKIMEDVMNHTYRELMSIEQMGLYVYENGFDILRHGRLKAHNGIIARPR